MRGLVNRVALEWNRRKSNEKAIGVFIDFIVARDTLDMIKLSLLGSSADKSSTER